MSATATSQEALEGLLARAGDGVFALDRDRRFVMFNEGCRRITGYAAEELLGTNCPCHDILACKDEQGRSLRGRLCPGLDVFRGETDGSRQRMQIERKDGSTAWVETTYMPIRSESGDIECVLGVVRDISDGQDGADLSREVVSGLREEVPAGESSAAAGSDANGGSESRISSDLNLDGALRRIEREVIEAALQRAGRQRSRAAQLMGISRSRLYRRMEALGVDPDREL